MQADAVLPTFSVRPGSGDGAENLAAWRAATSVLFDVEPNEVPFEAEIMGYSLGTVLFGSSRSTAQRFIRDEKVIRRSGIDHLLIQVYTRGCYSGFADGRVISTSEGDISILDLARTFETAATAFENVNLVVPRALLSLDPDDHSLHGLSVPAETPLAALIRSHMLELVRVCTTTTQVECERVVDLSLAMLNVLVAESRQGLRVPRKPEGDSLLGRICIYIENHVAEPDLTVPRLCAHFGMSRASLYRLFDPLGGIATYVRNQRLKLAYKLLSQRNGSRERLNVIASRLGFNSEDTFARAFKDRYGLSPRHLRQQGRREPSNWERVDSIDNQLAQWLQALGEVAVASSPEKEHSPAAGS